MNSAKKIMKNQTNEKKTKEPNGIFSLGKMTLMIIGGILVAAMFVAALCYEQFRPRLVLTVNDEKVYLTDMMYDIYSAEASYNSMSDIYKQFYGTDYWSMEVDDEGTTGATAAKKEVMSNMKQRQVLCLEAANKDMTLTAEEIKACDEKAVSLRGNMTKEQKAMRGLSESALKKILKKEALAAKYKQYMIDSFDIDDAAITKTISKKDNRQYDLQYYYVKTTTTDSENNTVDKTAEEKATLKTKMEDLLKKAETAEDFSKLLGDDDQTGIEYKTENLLETNKDFLTDALRKQVKKMKNGEISGLLEGEDGYYFIKMENNNSTEAYDKAVEDAISTEEETQFKNAYQIFSAPYEMTVNKKQWNRVKLGSYTTATK